MKSVAALIGVFDLFHFGHLRIIQRAAQLADNLVVIVVADKAVRQQKGEGRPIIPECERMAIVAGLAGVSVAILSNSFDPWDAVADYEQRTNNRISFFIRGQDQDHIPLDRILANGIKVIPLGRTPGISTSEIARKLTDAGNLESH